MYTKGKWEITQFDDGLRVITETEHVAKIEHIHPDPLNLQYNANARLIAAAPELLEACKATIGLIKYARKYFPKSIKNSDKFLLENTCATVGKAIAKAEGE